MPDTSRLIQLAAPTGQRGWTLWGLLGAIMLIAFFALLVLKLFPPYMDNLKLKRALETVAAEPATPTATRYEIINRVQRVLYVDYGSDIVDLNRSLKVEKIQNGRALRIQYEVVVHLAFNVSALLEFDNYVEARTGR